MRKCDNFKISCYRYAPESFKAYMLIGYTGKYLNKPKYKEIPLTYNEKSECGNAYCCGNTDSAIKVLKRIIRAKERKVKQYITYGNFYTNKPREYAFTQQLAVDSSKLSERLYAYKEWKDFCNRVDWKISSYVVEELTFDPDHPNKQPTTKEIFEELNKDRKIKITFKTNTLYQSEK